MIVQMNHWIRNDESKFKLIRLKRFWVTDINSTRFISCSWMSSPWRPIPSPRSPRRWCLWRRDGPASQINQITRSIYGASWRTVSEKSSPKSQCLYVHLKTSNPTPNLSSDSYHSEIHHLLSAGELQRAPVHAAASLRRSRVLRTAGSGRQVPELSGADVLRGSFHCFLLLHYCSPYRQTLQPSAGRDLRAGPHSGVRLQVPLRAGDWTSSITVDPSE